jgi:adenylate cyclase
VSGNLAERTPGFRARPVGDLLLRGRLEPLRAFEPLPGDEDHDVALREYRAAFSKLESGDPTAVAAFATLVGKSPDGKLASFHLKRCLSGEIGVEISME